MIGALAGGETVWVRGGEDKAAAAVLKREAVSARDYGGTETTIIRTIGGERCDPEGGSLHETL